MSIKYNNPCIRCGTERIVVKTWKEKIGNSTIVNTETACPNKECQSKVNKDNKKQKEKYDEMKLRSEQRAVERKAVNDAKRLQKSLNQR